MDKWESRDDREEVTETGDKKKKQETVVLPRNKPAFHAAGGGWQHQEHPNPGDGERVCPSPGAGTRTWPTNKEGADKEYEEAGHAIGAGTNVEEVEALVTWETCAKSLSACCTSSLYLWG
ncbi:unnamed protein product [Arctogadus glacialis]